MSTCRAIFALFGDVREVQVENKSVASSSKVNFLTTLWFWLVAIEMTCNHIPGLFHVSVRLATNSQAEDVARASKEVQPSLTEFFILEK
jgi:hypothetical protein